MQSTTRHLEVIVSAALLAGALGLVQAVTARPAQAQDTNPTSMSYDIEDTVAPAEEAAYEAGVKSYNQCLSQHGYKFAVPALEHVTGNTYIYSYVVIVPNWAALDTNHAMAGVCDAVFEADVNPHLLSETAAVTTVMPGFSHYPNDMAPTTPLTEVISFTLKPGMAAYNAFTNGVKAIYAAEAKSNWPYYSELDEMNYAGPGAPDFQLIIPAKSWAEIGTPESPSVWKMLANVDGQRKADEIRKSIEDAIASSEAHVDRSDPSLSYTPSQQ
ncbi:MAG TPA: hypothetical protein VMD06_09645 [Steroidobacteraceae bacterium]|nr:hypothetical protein [Steroidobacteraceae bacterium]